MSSGLDTHDKEKKPIKLSAIAGNVKILLVKNLFLRSRPRRNEQAVQTRRLRCYHVHLPAANTAVHINLC